MPPFDPLTWDFRVWGLVEAPLTLTWAAMQAQPTVTIAGDLHCVTRWSTMNHEWSGVPPAFLLRSARVRPDARYVLLHGEGGYSANVPLEVLLRDNVVLATHHDGEPLSPEHGAPLRAVIPARYAWKSVKWLRGLEILADDRPGFWEGYGYSSNADPWREERFA